MWGLRSHCIGVAPGPTATGYDLRPSVPASSPENRVTAPPCGVIVRICWAKACKALRTVLVCGEHW